MTACTICSTFSTKSGPYCHNCAQEKKLLYTANETHFSTIAQDKDLSCADCGNTNPMHLILRRAVEGYEKGLDFPPLNRFLMVGILNDFNDGRASDYIVRCRNCQSRFNRSPGRPPKLNAKEALQRRKDCQRDSHRVRRVKLREAFSEGCDVCGQPAVGLIWEGAIAENPLFSDEEQGRRSKQKSIIKQRVKELAITRLIQDSAWRLNWKAYCTSHDPTKIQGIKQRVLLRAIELASRPADMKKNGKISLLGRKLSVAERLEADLNFRLKEEKEFWFGTV